MTDVTTRLLLAHAEAHLRHILKHTLQQAGYTRILEVGGGAAAIQRLIEGPFDVLITGAYFDDLPDFVLLKAVRSGRLCSRGLPIIVVHGEAEADSLEPVVRAHNAIALPVQAVSSLPLLTKAALQGHSKPRVLIIEDDTDTGRFLTSALADLYSCEWVNRGDTGLARWREGQYALVLLDMMLPGLHGGDVLKAIRQTDAKQRIIILTSHGSLDRYRATLLTGADEYLDKPIAVEALRATCERVLQVYYYQTGHSRLTETLDEVGYHIRTAREHLASGQAHEAQFQIQGALGALCRDHRSQIDDPMAPELDTP